MCAFGSVGGSLGCGQIFLSGTAAARGRYGGRRGSVRLMRGVRTFLWAIAGVAAAAVGMAGRQAAADTLEWVLVQAYQNNPSLNAQRAALRATEENVPQALSGYRPRLSVTASGGAEYVNSVSQIPANGQLFTVPFAQTFYPRKWLLLPKKPCKFNDVTFCRNDLLSVLLSVQSITSRGYLLLNRDAINCAGDRRDCQKEGRGRSVSAPFRSRLQIMFHATCGAYVPTSEIVVVHPQCRVPRDSGAA
jgi:hypothetical protein